MEALCDTSPYGMASWDRDFVLKHVDLAMEATSVVLAIARWYPDTSIAELKANLTAVWEWL
jgi:hypothetical protein